jgi:ribose transport system permease protein
MSSNHLPHLNTHVIGAFAIAIALHMIGTVLISSYSALFAIQAMLVL